MKKSFNPVTILILFYILIFTIPIFAQFIPSLLDNPFDYARITDVDYKAELVDEFGSLGKVVVTEKLTFDIHAFSENNLFWELWRDLPEQTVDGVKVSYKVNYVKQILENGDEILYDESPKLYWDDSDYIDTISYGPRKWYHSKGPYNEEKRNYECLLFYVDGLYREKPVFEIQYEMNNASLQYQDCSELYLSMYSEKTIKYLNSFKGQILIPDKDMPDKNNYFAHTFGTNSNTFPFEESDSLNIGYHTFSFDLDKNDLKFKPYNQYIEFTLVSFGEDKHKIADYASINDYTSTDVLDDIIEEQKEFDQKPENFHKTKSTVFLILFILSIIIIISTLTTNKQINKKYKFFKPSIEIDFFREIPSNLDPYFASALAFCKDKNSKFEKHGYSAIILSLARKDYIELKRINENKDWNFNNVKIVLKSNPYTPSDLPESNETSNTPKTYETLSITEQQYFNLIIRHSKGTEISMKDFQNKVSSDYSNTDSFVKKVESAITTIGTSDGYFQNANYDTPKQKLKTSAKTNYISGLLILILFNLISYQTPLDLAFGAFFILGFTFIFRAIYLNKISNKYILLTQFGEDEYVKWHGLYKFLNSETLIKERTVVELPLWEQYLIYATAFGISKKVIKALKIRCPEMASSKILSNPYYHSRSFYHSSYTFRTATRNASHSAHISHGGYGRAWWLRRWRSWWWRWPEEVINTNKIFNNSYS